MKLGVEVGHGHIVLDGDPAPSPPKKGTAPQFSAHVCCGQRAGWIKMPHGTEIVLAPYVIVRIPLLLAVLTSFPNFVL